MSQTENAAKRKAEMCRESAIDKRTRRALNAPMQSMTGFGRGTHNTGGRTASVEAASVNRKQAEIVAGANSSSRPLRGTAPSQSTFPDDHPPNHGRKNKRIQAHVVTLLSFFWILVSLAEAGALDNYLQHTRPVSQLDKAQADARAKNRGIAFIWDDENQDHERKRAIIARLCEVLRNDAEIVFLPRSALAGAPAAVHLALPLVQRSVGQDGIVNIDQGGPALLLFDAEVSSYYGHITNAILYDSLDSKLATRNMRKFDMAEAWVATLKQADYEKLLMPLFKALRDKRPLITPVPLVLNHNTGNTYHVFIDDFTESEVTIRFANGAISYVPLKDFDQLSRDRIQAWLEIRAASGIPHDDLLTLRNVDQVEIRARILARDGDRITLKREDGKEFEINTKLLDAASRRMVDLRIAP